MSQSEHSMVADWWKSLAMFLAGCVVTMVAAYFQYGASRSDIKEAIALNNQLWASELKAVNASQAKAADTLDRVQLQIQRMSLAIGVDADQGVYVNGKPYYGKGRK